MLNYTEFVQTMLDKTRQYRLEAYMAMQAIQSVQCTPCMRLQTLHEIALPQSSFEMHAQPDTHPEVCGGGAAQMTF